VDKLLKSVIQGQYDTRPVVTFPTAGRHCRLTGTKLHCLVTEAHACEKLVEGYYLTAEWPGVESVTAESQVRHPSHYTNRPPDEWEGCCPINWEGLEERCSLKTILFCNGKLPSANRIL